MHSAPSVSYPAGRCRFAAALSAAVWAAGVLVLAAWMAATPGPTWRHGLAAAALAAGALASWAAWLRSPRGELHWDGAGWRWQAHPRPAGPPPPPLPGALRLRLDLQRWLLVAWRGGGAGAPRWLWLERGRAPEHWEALRRAVYSRARTEGPRGQEPPPAEP